MERDGQGLPSLSVRDGQTLLSLSVNSGQIFYIQKNDILPTQAREGQSFPRVVPRATFPRLGWKNIPILCICLYQVKT